MSNVIHAHHAERIILDEGRAVVTEYFQGSHLPGASLAVVDLDGVQPKRVNERSTKMLYVLDGFVGVRMDGDDRMLAPGDAMLIRPGEAHELRGGPRGSFVLVCSPAFSGADEKVVK
jgi:quercetin dioxygenase-like cupin family protein